MKKMTAIMLLILSFVMVACSPISYGNLDTQEDSTSALKDIINHAKSEGYVFKSLDQLS